MSAVFDDAALDADIDLAALVDVSIRAEREGPIVLVFAIGTSDVSAALIDGRGNEVSGSHISVFYGGSEPAGETEVEADALVQLVERAIDVAVARAESFVSRIDYVASCCFWHGLVGVDNQGTAVTKLINRTGQHAAEIIEDLRSRFDETKNHSRTGAAFHHKYWPAKLLWLRQKEPAFFGRVTQWLSFSDYLFLQLFGVATTSVSMASATGLFNQENCDWDKELTAGLGLLWQQLPEISQPGQTLRLSFVNYVTRWPLLEGAAWYPAIGDGAATNIGAGCVTPDRVGLTIGASGGMRVLFSGTAPQTLPAELFCYRADRDRVVIGGYLTDRSDLIARTRDAPKSDTENDESKQQLGSVMEATCHRFASLARDIEKLAPNADIVAVRDSSVPSPMFFQELADGLGRPIEASPVDAPSKRGAGLLALEAIGKIDSIETIDTPRGEIYEPGMSNHTNLKIET